MRVATDLVQYLDRIFPDWGLVRWTNLPDDAMLLAAGFKGAPKLATVDFGGNAGIAGAEARAQILERERRGLRCIRFDLLRRMTRVGAVVQSAVAASVNSSGPGSFQEQCCAHDPDSS